MFNSHCLKEELDKIDLLYIENKYEFRGDAAEFLEEYFNNIYHTQDMEESISLFKKHYPKIVIIDIDLSNFDWVKIVKQIKEIKYGTKIIILSRFDGQKILLDAIDNNITKYLIKPIGLSEFSNAIKLTRKQLEHENNIKLFNTYIYNVYNYQKSMLVMVKGCTPVVSNQIFLDFFDTYSMKHFNKKFVDLGDLFLQHDGYLYNQVNRYWLDEINKHKDTLYHVMIKNKEGEKKHFLFKYHLISQGSPYAILSFDDITELDLVQVQNTERLHNESTKELIKKDKQNIYNLLELLHKSKINVHIYNYYKGLTIVHDADIIEVQKDSVVIKTVYLQQKAIQIEGKVLISSEALPYTISSNKVSKINFDRQTVKLENLQFSKTSPATRRTIRLSPSDKYSVSLFIHNQRYKTKITIIDISVESINLKFEQVPTKLKKGDKVIIDMILTYQNKPIIINSKAVVLAPAKDNQNSNIIFLLDIGNNMKNTLLQYISSRQIEIIKEFKKIQGKTI